MKKLKRILAAVMVFALCLTLFPSMVLAEATAPPFTVTDGSGRSYALQPTTIESTGFTAYYKIVVPEDYGSLTFTAQGTTLGFAMCANSCYSYDVTSGSTGDAFTVYAEHANGKAGSCLQDDSIYNNAYTNWNQYVTATGTYVDIQLFFGEDMSLAYGVLVEIAKSSENAPPFTVTDGSGHSYDLQPTTIESTGFTAYYKIVVPEDYGSLTFTAQGTTLGFAMCANSCYSYDVTSGSTGDAFTVYAEHANGKAGSCLQDDSIYNNAYTNWNQYVTATGTYVDIQLFFGEDMSLAYGVLVQIGTDGGADAPTLTVPQNAVTRSSHAEATVTFESNEAGAYYYAVADSDASEPTVNTSGEGTPMVVGDNTIELTGLTAGAKKLYLMAKDESGNVTAKALVIDIPAFIEKTYTLSIFFMPGQTNDGWRILHATADGTAAEVDELGKTVSGIKANQTVNVWFNIPDAAKQLKSVALINDADKTAVQTKVTAYNQFQFTMPAADVRSSTNWLELKDAETTRYTLSATVTKLWDHIEDKDTNVKGNVVFTDENGVEITQAAENATVNVTATPRNTGGYYEFAFDEWKEATGITISDADRKNSTFTFQMPGNNVSLFAEFKNVGTTVTWGSSPAGAPKVVVNGNTLDETTYVYRTGSTATAYIGEQGWEDGWKFVKWSVTTVDGSDYTKVTYAANGNPQVELDGTPVWITAVFEAKAFANVTAEVDENCTGMGSASVMVGSNTGRSCLVYEGQTVTLTATPGARYKFTGWTFVGIGQPADFAADGNRATFTMPKTSTDFTVKASFAVDPDKASSEAILEDAVLYDTDGETLIKNADQDGMNFTIMLDAEQDVTNLSEMILKFTCSEYATVKQKGASDIWPAAGKACHMRLDTPVTFVVTSEKGDMANEYTVEIKQEKKRSSDKEITGVGLIYNGETFATGKLTETETASTWTVTLKDDIDSTLLGKIGTATDVFMKIDYTGVSLAQEKGYDDATSSKKWDSGNVMCGVSPGGQKKFTVRAEDGSTKDYIIAITKPNVSEKPVLSDGSATRTSDKEATIKFTSSAAGHYYYKVVESGAAEPDIDTSKSGSAAVAGSNTITLNNLTAGARDIYIVVKNAAGDVSSKLKIAILAFGEDPDKPDEGDFTITYTGPTGGKLVPSRSKANKGDVITVTAVPDAGMQMVAGSMKYTLSTPGGASTPITDGTFTMPGANVTLSCKWEAVKTSTDGITGFVIDGVAGVVDNTTNTISVVMAYGTDVTKLIPIISGNNIASISPASGQMVDFTNSVRYTVTLTDGTVKYYTVTVYVQEGTAADKMWDKLTDFYDQTPWWEYADHQVSTGRYPKYW